MKAGTGTGFGERLAAVLVSRNVLYRLCPAMLLALTLGIYTFETNLSTIGDNAQYVVLARSIAQGEGYRHINEPDRSFNTKYPPGFPLLLAASESLFPGNIMAMKVLVFILFLACFPVCYLLFRDRLPVRWLGPLLLLVAVNPQLLNSASQLISEIPYLLVSATALLFLSRGTESDRGGFPWTGLVLAVLAAHVRTVGIVFAPAGALALARRRRFRHSALFVLAFVLLLLPWNERNRRVADAGDPYLSNFLRVNEYRRDLGTVGPEQLLERVWRNIRIYRIKVPEVVIGNLTSHNIYSILSRRLGNTPVYAVHYVLLALILFGFGLRLARGPTVLEWYVAVYMAVLLLWPSVWSGPRFLVPIAPLVAAYFFDGLGGLQSRFGRIGRSRFFVPAVAVVLLAANSMSLARGSQPYSRAWINYFEAARWAETHIQPGSVIACRKPFLFHLVSGHLTINYPFVSDPDEVVRGMVDRGARYLVVDSLGFSTFRLYLAPALKARPELFEPIFRLDNPRTYIMKIRVEPIER